jgi:DinB superfamily
MKIESTSFGPAQLAGFFGELIDRERLVLVERLERASARLEELAGRVPPDAIPGDAGAWSSLEVLAHIAVLSKFYGVVAHKVGTGTMTELDLLGQVNMRDVMGQQFAQRDPADLAASAQADHRRTIEWLRRASPADLLRRCDTGGGRSMTAEDVARLALCGHLEQHLDQLEASLA